MGKKDKNRLAPLERRQLFLQAIARGATVKEAAAAARVDRTTPYQWAKENANFKRDWEEVKRTRLHQLQDTAFELAMEGDVQLIKFLLVRWEAQERSHLQEQEPRQVHLTIRTQGETDDNHPARPFIEIRRRPADRDPA